MLIRALVLAVTALLFSGTSRAQNDPDWYAPQKPFRIAGNLYYVGSRDLASYLITTPQGDMLINSNFASSVPQIRHSVEELGFHFSDIKILLISHAHIDHAGGSALIKKRTGAKYMVMEADVPVIESGGRNDFAYAHSAGMHFQPTKVDRILHDGSEVRLGGTVLVAHLTPGHTKGCTTWTMKVTEGSKTYNVVIVGSPNVNPGYKLTNNAQYPQIAQDYEKTFRVLKSLPCDIFLGAHGSYFDLQEKLARMKPGAASPFIDPKGYKNFVAEHEAMFHADLVKQQARKP